MGSNFAFNVAFFKRFYRQLGIVFPKFLCLSTLLFFLILVLVLLEQVVVYFIGLVPSKYYLLLGERNLKGFWKHTVESLALVLTMAIILSLKKYVWMLYYIRSRKVLTEYLQKLYLADINYYKLNVLDSEIDNVDQRIAQDIDKMCNIFGEIIPDLLVSPFNIAFYSYICWEVTGWIGPMSVYLFFIVSTVINKFLMSPIVKFAAMQEQLEGEFRYKHMQFRLNSESAAFYRCGQTENVKVTEKFHNLLDAQKKLNGKQFFLSISIFMASYFGSILSYVIIAIPIFGGIYDHLTPTEISSLISKSSFLILYLIFNFTRIINMAPKVSEMAGCSHRVGQLMERLLKMIADEKKEDDDNNIIITVGNDSSSASTSSSSGSFGKPVYTLNNASISVAHKAINSRLLAKDLNLKISTGCSMIITGDSGIGKTSLLRTLDGLWPLCHGKIQRFMPHGRGGIFYLPQKPYLTNGTLRQQITFPDLTCSKDLDDEIMKNLQIAGLEELLDRTGSLDASIEWHWEDILSPGEAQRLAFVRLFYHKPTIAILDESTSQVSEGLEVTLYENCLRLNMTLISIGHRKSLTQFHDQELRLLENGNWRLIWHNGDKKRQYRQHVREQLALNNCPFDPYFSDEDDDDDGGGDDDTSSDNSGNSGGGDDGFGGCGVIKGSGGGGSGKGDSNHFRKRSKGGSRGSKNRNTGKSRDMKMSDGKSRDGLGDGVRDGADDDGLKKSRDGKDNSSTSSGLSSAKDSTDSDQNHNNANNNNNNINNNNNNNGNNNNSNINGDVVDDDDDNNSSDEGGNDEVKKNLIHYVDNHGHGDDTNL